MLCRHCLYSSEEKILDEVETSILLSTISEFQRIATKGPTLNLFGGEPLMRKDIFDIINYSESLGISVGITTNATIGGDRVRRLKASQISRISIDLHGSNAVQHDWLRSEDGHFEKSVAAISEYADAGKEVSVNCVLHSGNIGSVEDVLEFASRLPIKSVSFYLFSPVGRGKTMSKQLVSGKAWKDAHLKTLRFLADRNPSFVVVWERAYEERSAVKDLPKPMCHGNPSEALDIRCDGNVYYCGLLMSADAPLIDADAHCLGNISKDSLTKILGRRKEKAFDLEHVCPALALHNSIGQEGLVDPRVAQGDILPTCPYDWTLLGGKEERYKKKFAHINNQPTVQSDGASIV